MFFGFSRKFGNRIRNKNRNRNRKKKFTTRKKGNSSNNNNNNNNNNNVKFKIEEIDTPLTPTPRVKTIKTDSTSPIILSDTRTISRSHSPTRIRSSSNRSRTTSRSSRSSSGSNTKSKRDVQMRTPTPYHSSDSESKSTSMSTVKSLNSSGDIILFFMDMLTTVKLYHWKTMNYATHKATDELYDDLNKYVDEFVEVLLGYKGGVRAKLPRTQVTLHDCNSIEEFKKKIDGYKNVLIGFTSRFDGKKNSDLLNIRDEILATLNKSLYVMSFK
jgi:DNA-binding ferritin-like protein